MSSLLDAQQAAGLVACAVLLAFVLQWTDSSHWWRDELATTFVLKDIFLLAVLIEITLSVWFPVPVIVLEWTYLVSMCLIAVVVVWRMVVMYKVKPPRHLASLHARAARLILRMRLRHGR